MVLHLEDLPFTLAMVAQGHLRDVESELGISPVWLQLLAPEAIEAVHV